MIAHDTGRSVNPALVAGQLHGGYAHGLGYVFFEVALYSEEGAFVTPLIPRLYDRQRPELACEPETIHFESACSQNPEFRSGAWGQPGTLAAPADGVEDALHAIGRPAEIGCRLSARRPVPAGRPRCP